MILFAFLENDLVGNLLVEPFLSTRSKTMPTLGRPKMTAQKMLNEGERLGKAKEIVERAIKVRETDVSKLQFVCIKYSHFPLLFEKQSFKIKGGKKYFLFFIG